MSTEREELIRTICQHGMGSVKCVHPGCACLMEGELADALLAAGWRRPAGWQPTQAEAEEWVRSVALSIDPCDFGSRAAVFAMARALVGKLSEPQP